MWRCDSSALIGFFSGGNCGDAKHLGVPMGNLPKLAALEIFLGSRVGKGEGDFYYT